MLSNCIGILTAFGSRYTSSFSVSDDVSNSPGREMTTVTVSNLLYAGITQDSKRDP